MSGVDPVEGFVPKTYTEIVSDLETRALVQFGPDIDLTDIVENNHYWRDFLRAYEFSLPVEFDNNQSYILQVTCICPNGKRLSTEYALLRTK